LIPRSIEQTQCSRRIPDIHEVGEAYPESKSIGAIHRSLWVLAVRPPTLLMSLCIRLLRACSSAVVIERERGWYEKRQK